MEKRKLTKKEKQNLIFVTVACTLFGCFVAFLVIGCQVGLFDHKISDQEKKNIALIHEACPDIWFNGERDNKYSAVVAPPDKADSYIVISDPEKESEYDPDNEDETGSEWTDYYTCDFKKLELASHKGANDEWTAEDIESLDVIVSYYSTFESASYSRDGKAGSGGKTIKSETVTIGFFDPHKKQAFRVETLGGYKLPDEILSNEGDYRVSEWDIDQTINKALDEIRKGS